MCINNSQTFAYYRMHKDAIKFQQSSIKIQTVARCYFMERNLAKTLVVDFSKELSRTVAIRASIILISTRERINANVCRLA